MRKHVTTVINNSVKRGDPYDLDKDQLYVQYVLIPGIVRKMSFADKKMTGKSLQLGTHKAISSSN